MASTPSGSPVVSLTPAPAASHQPGWGLMSLSTKLWQSLVTRAQGRSPFLFFSDSALSPEDFRAQPAARGGWALPALSVAPGSFLPGEQGRGEGCCGGAAPWCPRAAPPGATPGTQGPLSGKTLGIPAGPQDPCLTDFEHTLVSGPPRPGTYTISVSPAALWAGTVAIPQEQ